MIVGQTIGSYQVIAKLGEGGMGEVYRARDLRLGRDVAVKVMPVGVARDTARIERFRREAHLLAALNHPNIATIHGLEQSEGDFYLVMELVEGDDLNERLAKGPVPVEEVLRIASQIAEALAAAHRKGITHRDVKPANIKLTPEGRVKILDFGLAKANRAGEHESTDDAATIVAISQPGLMLGTPAYMSPESVRGGMTGTAADTWGFGCVLYELLTGRRPFPASNVADIVASVLTAEPDWHLLPSSTPATVLQLIRRCLEKDAERRLQDAEEARIVLDQALRSGEPTPVPAADRTPRSLAVLPFVNASSDPQMDYLSDGLTESMIVNLSKLPQLQVTSHSATLRYKGQSERAQEIGRALGVEAVLTGRVLLRGPALRISAELVDVERGWQIWGEQYRRKAEDIFDAEEEITKEISENLRLKLSPETAIKLTRRPTESVEAFHLYLKGRFHWAKRTKEGLNKGLEFFRQAIERDPTYALAYAGLAEGYVPQGFYCFLPPTEAFPRARAAAEKALEIDPALPEAISVLGMVKTAYEWDPLGAEALLRPAIVSNPGYPRIRQALAESLSMQRRFEEASAELTQGLDGDPLSLFMNAAIVMNDYFRRNFDAAIERGRSIIELDPHFHPALLFLGLACQLAGHAEEAIGALETARALSGDSTLVVAALGGALAQSGQDDRARQIVHELDDVGRHRYVPQTFVAAIHAALGEVDHAMVCLERGRQDRCCWLARCVLLDARLDSLRSDARFTALMRAVGLP